MKEMRRFKQKLPDSEILKILERNTSGVLSMADETNHPYCVPLSYVLDHNSLYFHCAKEGHKMEVLRQNPQVCFCVIDQDEIIPEKYTTYFKSVIIYGKASVINDESKKRKALEILASKYSPNDPEGIQKEIDSTFDAVCMVEIKIEEKSGKQAIELVGTVS